MTGESVVKHCTTAAVAVAGERASNRGIQIKKLQQQHICQRDTGKETGKNSSHCLHGETFERQPEMFDKAPEKRSVKVVNKRLRGVSALARPFQIARKRTNENKRLTGLSTVVLFVCGFAKCWSASNWTVAHKAELRVVCASLQKCRGDLEAVLVAVDTVITRTKVSALFLFDRFDVTRAAR